MHTIYIVLFILLLYSICIYIYLFMYVCTTIYYAGMIYVVISFPNGRHRHFLTKYYYVCRSQLHSDDDCFFLPIGVMLLYSYFKFSTVARSRLYWSYVSIRDFIFYSYLKKNQVSIGKIFSFYFTRIPS